MKTVIALRGPPNVGKSSTLNKVYDHLRNKYPNAPIRDLITNGDVRIVIEINGKLLGLESQGDPGGRLTRGSISLFAQEMECMIIVCATRTRGQTVDAIEALAPQYQINWIEKTREPDTAKHQSANEAIALDIIEQIETLLNP